jgi:hypothetical protein
MNDEQKNQQLQDAIREGCEAFYETHSEELSDVERITSFCKTLGFEIDQSLEEKVQHTMQRNLHTLLYNDVQLNKIKSNWCNLFNANVQETNKHTVSFGIGDHSPETKKNHLNLRVSTKQSVRQELLQNNLAALDVNHNLPLIAVKLYTPKAEEVKAFAEQMMEMFGVDAIFSTLPVQPEIRFVATEEYLIIEVTSKKSLELNFMTYLIRAFLTRIPEPDVQLDFSMKLGTNFNDLTTNHTENTIHDILNGLRINLEFNNNLKGFFENACNFFFSKAQNKEDNRRKNLKHCSILKFLSFVSGGVSLNTNLNLNMGAHEAQLMAKIPTVNIFDNNGIVSKPLGQAKMMMDSNEMFAPVLELMGNMEGKGEVYLFSVVGTVHGDVDVSGVFDLLMHVINNCSYIE